MPTKSTPVHRPDPKPPPIERHVLDYEIDDYVVAEDPRQLKALGDPTRTSLLALLLERAATTSQLAEALGKPKGTVGYHLKVLEGAGMIRVVRTARVRALTEKYYGRVGRTIVYGGSPVGGEKAFMLREALGEISSNEDLPSPMFTMRRIRLSHEAAAEFAGRIWELAEEYLALPRSGDTMYGFIAGLYPTDHAVLQDSRGSTT